MLTAIDQVANQNHLQLIKAVVPYIPPQTQKPLSLLVKLMEFRNVAFFFTTDQNAVNACGGSGEPQSAAEILADIREYCDESDQALIDQMGQLLSTIELCSLFAQQSAPEHT